MVRRRRLDPCSVWDREGVLRKFQEHDILPCHADAVWAYLGKHRDRDVPLSEVSGRGVTSTRRPQGGLGKRGAAARIRPSLPPAPPPRASRGLSGGVPPLRRSRAPPDPRATPPAPPSPGTQVPGLPKAAQRLFRSAAIVKFTSRVLDAKVSAGGEVVKLLVQLQTGEQVECVVMRYDPTLGVDPSQPGGRRRGRPRATVCVSSQVGCQMGCTFCATGTMGLKANLLPAEILEQVAHACLHARTPVRNLVFMGMGEPLDAYDEVVEAVRCLTHPRIFGLSARHLTVSTVGVVPRIRPLARDLPTVRLALSLHAPSQALRETIVPTARGWPLPDLLGACADWQRQTGQPLFVEYVLLAGVNAAPEHARQLAALLADHRLDAVVNVIPWNPVLADDGIEFEAPGEAGTAAFRDVLVAAGVRCTVRREKGQDLAAACGQLVVGGAGGKRQLADIEDLGGAPGGRAACAGG